MRPWKDRVAASLECWEGCARYGGDKELQEHIESGTATKGDLNKLQQNLYNVMSARQSTYCADRGIPDPGTQIGTHIIARPHQLLPRHEEDARGAPCSPKAYLKTLDSEMARKSLCYL